MNAAKIVAHLLEAVDDIDPESYARQTLLPTDEEIIAEMRQHGYTPAEKTPYTGWSKHYPREKLGEYVIDWELENLKTHGRTQFWVMVLGDPSAVNAVGISGVLATYKPVARTFSYVLRQLDDYFSRYGKFIDWRQARNFAENTMNHVRNVYYP